jgi:hypothetical protein
MDYHYLPNGERDIEGWMFNFSQRLQAIGASLGLTPAQIAAIENDYLACKYLLDMEDMFKAELHQRTEYKNTLLKGKIGTVITPFPGLPTLPATPVQVPAGIISRIESTVQLIKNSPNYDEAIGQALKIIAPGKSAGSITPLEKTVLKPTGKVVENSATEIKIKFTKGDTDGVIVYVNAPAAAPVVGAKIDAEASINWVEYGRFNYSPFVDTRKNTGTQPETRMYKLQYFEKDKPVGVQSDIIKVVAAIY